MYKTFKKGDGKSYEVKLRKIVEKVGECLIFGIENFWRQGLQKHLRFMKKGLVMGVVFSAVFLAVWVVMPANGAEAAFGRNFEI